MRTRQPSVLGSLTVLFVANGYLADLAASTCCAGSASSSPLSRVTRTIAPFFGGALGGQRQPRDAEMAKGD
jgi:hypothetical protein